MPALGSLDTSRLEEDAMRAIVKVMVCAVGLAILLGTPADTLTAYPKFVSGKTYCTCTCASNVGGTRDLAWENVGTCTGANGKGCKFKSGGTEYKGSLHSCATCKVDAQGSCNYSARAGETARPPAGVAPPREEMARPPAGVVPPREGKRPPARETK